MILYRYEYFKRIKGDVMDNIEIINSVDEKIEKVRTRSLDLSFNELMDMYEIDYVIIVQI